MKRLLVFSLLFTSMNTFGQESAAQKIQEQLSKDVVQAKKDLEDCENLYQKNIDSKAFTKPLAYPPKIEPTIQDSTKVQHPISPLIELYEKELREIKDKLVSCDSQLRVEAKANGVELPNVASLLPFIGYGSQHGGGNWECWSGPYHPVVLTLAESKTISPFAQVTSEFFQIYGMDDNRDGEYLSNNYYYQNERSSQSFLGGLVSFTNYQSTYRFSVIKESDKSLKLKVVLTVNQQNTYFDYSCKPLQIQKANGYGVDVNTGNAKKAGSNNGKATHDSKTNDTLED